MKEEFTIVHPLYDEPEEKVGILISPMEMTNSVRWSLLSLRGYLLLMIALLLYHVIGLALR